MDLLASLNPAQRQAVEIINGPVLVLAGPGSGKTRVLTYRVAYLIERGIAPYNILAVTFTNKAAREMRERLGKLVGETRLQDLTIGTFHATCARFLRRDGTRVGLGQGFGIYDEDDQSALIKQILKEMNLDDKKYRPGAVLGTISKTKNELIEPAQFVPESYWHEVVGRIYTRYQQLLLQNNAADFDDLLMLAVRLLRENPDVLERYHKRYTYLHVDEFQDTNIAQYVLMKLLADKYQNLFCVGDEDQCLVPGTQIQTPTGLRAIETICPGDVVTVGAGRGHTMNLPVESAHRNEFHGKLIEITTQRGHTIQVTPNHILFARLGVAHQVHYVYLMYRGDRGYRIGLVAGTRSDGIHDQLFPGLMVRCHQEHADKVWILRVSQSKAEAQYWEIYFAFKYGIPTTLFHGVGRGLALTEEQITRLFSDLDTRTRAAQLMSDLQLFPEFPHFRPKAAMRGPAVDRKIIHFNLFGDTRRSETSPWSAHRTSLNTTDLELKQQLIEAGYHPRPGRRKTWRVESSNLDYDKAENFVRTLAQSSGDVEISRSAFFSDTRSDGGITLSFDFQPASHIHPTMIVPVLEEGQVVDDQVAQVEWKDYAGFVYDLDISKVHNYIANGIVVHNSIYGWRGADYRNVLRFSEDFPNARVTLLEQNYRSTQTILDVAQSVIEKNKSRHEKTLWTENTRGAQITVYEAYDQDEEAQFVVDEIARLIRDGYRPGEVAVFYRTNAQSRVIETAFTRRGMSYQLVGGMRFYQRREVKDLLAYLRLLANPNDSVAFMRVLNVPSRGIGKTTMDNLEQWASKLYASPFAILQMLKKTATDQPPPDGTQTASLPADAFDARARKVLLPFAKLLDELLAALPETKLSDLLDLVVQKTGYEIFTRDGTDEGDDRWENVVELGRATRKYSSGNANITLSGFLEEASLQADIDTMKESANAPTLMTLHTAKGLEFRAVFIVGLEEKLFPHSRSYDDPAQMEEERRLCYVGITRAKERLYLLRTFRRTLYGNSEPSEPSRYLNDIPRELMRNASQSASSKIGTGAHTWKSADRDSHWGSHSSHTDDSYSGARQRRTWEQSGDGDFVIDDDDNDASNKRSKSRVRRTSASQTPRTPLPAKPVRKEIATQFKAGDKVSHPSFGDGVVISSQVAGGEEEVQIAFVGKGVKRLIARFANLKKK